MGDGVNPNIGSFRFFTAHGTQLHTIATRHIHKTWTHTHTHG